MAWGREWNFQETAVRQVSLIPLVLKDYNDKVVNFVVHHILPIFKYLFIVGMLGAVPVIVITAIRTAQSIFETDESARDHKA